MKEEETPAERAERQERERKERERQEWLRKRVDQWREDMR